MSWWCRLTVFAGILFALGACGVRGDLDPPPGAEQTKNDTFILDKLV